MKKILFGIFLTISLVSYAQEDICKDLDHLIELEMHQHGEIANLRTNMLTQDYDLKYHRLEWQVDPAVHFISGTITTYFVPRSDEFDQINFDFEDNMTINSVLYHGQSLSYEFTDGDNLRIDLPETINFGTLDSISIDYEGIPASGGFGSFATDTHDGSPILWTLSEPYGAKAWWPCKQDLTDKIDSIDIFVTTPQVNKVGTNGVLINELLTGDGNVIYHWKHRYPIPAYLISIAVTNYAEFSDYVYLNNGDSILILNYVFPEDLDDAQIKLQSTVEQMELYNELFGIYPFAGEKYGHAQFAWGGGMEHQTMSSMGSFSYGLQAHELAHQWFGDKVTCGSWEDIWLNEGFASYLTGLTDEFLSSDPNDWMNWKTYNIGIVTNQPGGSTWVDDTTSVGRIFNSRLTYRKGALILHMLRWKLGDADFFQGVRNYLEDSDLAFGYARTDDLKYHLELISGQDLTGFFSDWFYGQGYPSYNIQYTPGIDGIQITVEQETSHSSVDFFEMPIPIKVSDGINDTILVLDHNFSGQIFDIDLPFEPTTLEFDPDYWIISKDNSIEFIATSSKEIEMISSYIELSPNPGRTEFEIRIGESLDMSAFRQIIIVDSQGLLLERINDIEPKMNVNIENWASGTYNLIFRTDKGYFVKRFVKI